jgi:outer membrane protein assembly factor BamB
LPTHREGGPNRRDDSERIPLHRFYFCASLVILTIASICAGAEPEENKDVTYHVAPKPLLPGTITEDWPSFLGPTHNAVTRETNLVASFPAGGPPLVWEMKRGSGYSAPAISAGKLLVLHRVGEQEVVDCLDPETGKRFWRFAYPTEYRDRYGLNDGPRGAPVIDGGLAYTYGVEGKLHCLDLATGAVKWKHDILSEFSLPQQFFGVGDTPLVEGDHVIINVGAAPKGPCVVAFNKITGQVAWKTDEKLSNTWGPSYASPIPATVNGVRRVFVFAGGESRPPTGGVMSVDPATGKVDFAMKHRSRTYESVNASSPLIIGNQLFVSECYGSGGSLIDLKADGSAKELWNSKALGTHFMNAIAKDGYLYGVDGHGPLDCPLVCLDLKTGEEMWRKEINFRETVPFGGRAEQREVPLARASLILCPDGRFLCLGEFGHLLWVDLSPKGYQELSRSWPFFAGETWTGPVLSHGLLYVCQNTRDALHGGEGPKLLCYDVRASK